MFTRAPRMSWRDPRELIALGERRVAETVLASDEIACTWRDIPLPNGQAYP